MNDGRPTLDVVEPEPGMYVRKGALVRVARRSERFTMEVRRIVAHDDGTPRWVEGWQQGAHPKARAVHPSTIKAVLP